MELITRKLTKIACDTCDRENVYCAAARVDNTDLFLCFFCYGKRRIAAS